MWLGWWWEPAEGRAQGTAAAAVAAVVGSLPCSLGWPAGYVELMRAPSQGMALGSGQGFWAQ